MLFGLFMFFEKCFVIYRLFLCFVSFWNLRFFFWGAFVFVWFHFLSFAVGVWFLMFALKGGFEGLV